VKKFEKSYRIPIEIGILTQKSLPNTLRDLLDKYDEFISTKEYIGDHGIVEILLSNSREEEYQKLAQKILRLSKQPQEILVLFKYNMAKIHYDHPFFKLLENLNVQWKELENYNYETPELLIGTIHGTKGLECNTIIIPEVNTYITSSDRQLLYVAITRSRKKLILSAHKSTQLIKIFESTQVLEVNPTDGA
jgi:superfamily I DNA/RNA helicase